MVQLVSKFAARISQYAYISRFFTRQNELHMFHRRMSRLLVHATYLLNYATRDLYVLTRIPTQVGLPVYTNLLTSCVTQ